MAARQVVKIAAGTIRRFTIAVSVRGKRGVFHGPENLADRVSQGKRECGTSTLERVLAKAVTVSLAPIRPSLVCPAVLDNRHDH